MLDLSKVSHVVRKLSARELADLPSFGWENAKVDTNKYYVSFMSAYEIDPRYPEIYEALRNEGLVCQVVNGVYIVAPA
jgi:hypothetical protein